MPILKLRPASSNHQGQSHTNTEGWTSINYSKKSINDLVEAAPGDLKATIVSLPTPLANLELAKKAFETINLDWENPSKVQKGYFAQLISQVLDIWEGLFTFHQNSEGIAFTKWSFDRIEELKKSNVKGHELLGRTLELFLRPNDSNNILKQISGFSIISKNHEPFAGTSPYTGFYFNFHGNINDINWKASDGRELFNGQVKHLNERDPEFQRFMYQFRLAIMQGKNGLYSSFEDFLTYINNCLLKSELKTEIAELDRKGYSWTEFSNQTEPLKDSEGTVLELISSQNTAVQVTFPSQIESSDIDQNCSFFLKHTQANSDLPQTVLVLSKGASPAFNYHKRLWDNIKDKEQLKAYVGDFETNFKERTLPGIGFKFPYLTVGDLLDEYIVNVGHPIDKSYFITGSEDDSSYLLPLKPLFFKYFKPQDLCGNVNGLKIKVDSKSPESVKITLTIPITGNGNERTIDLVRFYSKTNKSRQEVQKDSEGIGVVVELRTGLGIFPFLKTNQAKYNDLYKIFLTNSGQLETKLGFVDKDGKPFISTEKISEHLIGIDKVGFFAKITRAKREVAKNKPSLDVFELHNTYPAAIIAEATFNHELVSNYIFPLWEKANKEIGNEKASYAIDFGTTNSHIVGKVGDNAIKPLSFLQSSNLILTLHKNLDNDDDKTTSVIQFDEIQDRMLLPSVVDRQQSQVGFPTRTVLVEKENCSPNDFGFFSAQSFYFNYQLLNKIPSEKYVTNLKWSDDDRNGQRVKSLIEQWMYMIRTAAIIDGADPQKIKLTRFIPNSLPQWQLSNLKAIWENVVSKVLHLEKPSITVLSESEGPYHKLALKLSPKSTCLIIDIGGGSTDILIIDQKTVSNNLIANPDSFYFAGNALYGDFEDFLNPERVSKTNGLSLAIKESVSLKLKNSSDLRIKQIEEIFTDLLSDSTVRSQDIIDFCFKHTDETQLVSMLKGNTEIARKMRLIYLLHLAAIVYYAGEKSRSKNIDTPTEILVSGNGSKYISYITQDEDSLSEFLILMLQAYSGGEKSSLKCKLLTETNRKEITAIGGLMKLDTIMVDTEPDPYFWNDWNIPSSKVTFRDLSTANYNEEKNSYISFVDCFIAVCKATDVIGRFNVEINFDTLKEELLANNVDNMLRARKERLRFSNSLDGLVNETTFFYPVMGAIDSLLKKL